MTWLEGCDDDKVGGNNIQWIQPSVVDTDEYYSSLKLAFDLLLSVNHVFVINNTIELSELGGFNCVQEARYNAISNMERDMVNLPPLSLRLLGKRALSKTLIPGACQIGQRGIWQKGGSSEDESDRGLDLTQAVAYFDRDSSSKGIPSTKVTTLFAFEKHAPAPVFHEFDPTQIEPAINEGNNVDLAIPTVMAKGNSIYKEKLVSVIDDWLPPPIIICDQPSTADDKKWCLEDKDWTNEEDDVFQMNGFRLKCQAHPFHYDSEIPRQTFGISHKAASPNKTAVNPRSRWSSKEYCDYLLSEERGPEDFFHLLQNKYTDKDGGSINQPLISVIHMSAYEIKHVKGIKLDRYLEDEKQRVKEKELEHKKKILSEKISSADCILAKREHDAIHGTRYSEMDAENDHIIHSFSETLSKVNPYSDEVEQPPLSVNIIAPNDMVTTEQSIDSTCSTINLKGYQWRKLPKSILGDGFYELNKHKIQTCLNGDLLNKCNTPRTIGRVNASKGIDYKIDESLFDIKPEVQMIKDILSDRIHISKSIQDRQVGRDKLLTSNQEEALEYILNIPLANFDNTDKQGSNSFDNDIVDEEKYQDKLEDSIINDSIFMQQNRDKDNVNSKVIVAVKHSNYETLKEIIDENGVEVDTYDEFGNTLFIIACQQGNKKMSKFLLRRGAYINAQNHAGNTGLHYLYEYGHVKLAEYLIEKGADDSYLNSEGLTCYEGVNRKNLEDL